MTDITRGKTRSGYSHPVGVVNDDGQLMGILGNEIQVKAGGSELSTDIWGNTVTTQPLSLFESTFTFAVSSRKWLIYHGSTEISFDSNNPDTNVRTVNGGLQIDVDATITSASAISRHCPKYQGNREYKFSNAMIMPNAASDAIARFGLITAENGVYFECQSGVLYAVRKSGGVVVAKDTITVPSTIDLTKGNVYDIRFQYRGVGDYEFFINLQKVHTMANLGTLTGPSMENPALPAVIELNRGTTDATVVCSCVDICIVGGSDVNEEYNSAYSENVITGTGIDFPVIVIHNPLLVGGETNTRSISFDRLKVQCDKKATFKVWLTRNPAAITGATLKALPDSFVTCDSTNMDATAVRATAVNTALCSFVTAQPVLAGQSETLDDPDPRRIHFDFVRGDYIIVTCNANNGVADTLFELGEEV